MNVWAQVERIWASLSALGTRRLAALGVVGLSVIAATIFSGYYLSRPTTDVLYSGLDRDDVVNIGTTLKQAGIPFDISADGTSVLVATGQGALARMTLAEKGLPHSGTVGNELFDKLGSLGLTSFMQEVTRVRAMEGELGRTIQMIRGVKAARVHIVIGDEGSFRREKRPASASVVIRTDGGDDRSTGEAIRHLVASAIPNLKFDEVTVLNVDGRLLASGPDSVGKSPDNLLSLEKAVHQDIRERINRTLAPYLSLQNFQVSVAARLNADKKQTSETIYDPESRVERSVRVTKQRQVSSNAAAQKPAGADANLPRPNNADADTKQSNDDNQKNEQLTNYEVSSKSITTTSSGFSIDALSVAVLVNRAALTASLGANATPEAIEKQVADIQQIVASAAGVRTERGDSVKVSVVDFVDANRELEPIPGPSILEALLRQSSALFNAGAVVTVAFLLIMFGVRPAIKAFAAQSPALAHQVPALGASDNVIALEHREASVSSTSPMLIEENDENDELLGAILARKDKAPQRHLLTLVDFDDEHAAAVLKQWMRQGANA